MHVRKVIPAITAYKTHENLYSRKIEPFIAFVNNHPFLVFSNVLVDGYIQARSNAYRNIIFRS